MANYAFLITVLNNKTIILLNLAEYPLSLPDSASGSSAEYHAIFRVRFCMPLTTRKKIDRI